MRTYTHFLPPSLLAKQSKLEAMQVSATFLTGNRWWKFVYLGLWPRQAQLDLSSRFRTGKNPHIHCLSKLAYLKINHICNKAWKTGRKRHQAVTSLSDCLLKSTPCLNTPKSFFSVVDASGQNMHTGMFVCIRQTQECLSGLGCTGLCDCLIWRFYHCVKMRNDFRFPLLSSIHAN